MKTAVPTRTRGRRRSGILVCLLLFAFCLLPASCGPKRNAPVAENATYGYCRAFYTTPTRYSVNDWLKEKRNIKKVQLKDYNTREPIDAANAELVVKSRVDGPMGPDFFPFSTREAAEIFAGTNGGTLIRLADVTVEIVRELGRN